MTEVEELFATFLKLQRSGKNARLNVECHAGKVWAALHVDIYQPPSPTPQQQHQHHPHRRATPSRLRRRARRAAARDHAAVEAVATKVIPIDEDEKNTGKTEDSVEETDVDIPPTAVQAVSMSTQHKHRAVHAVSKPNDDDDDSTVVVEKEEQFYPKEISQERLFSRLNALAPWPSPRAPSNQCEKCGKSFGSNRALTNHRTREHLQDL